MGEYTGQLSPLAGKISQLEAGWENYSAGSWLVNWLGKLVSWKLAGWLAGLLAKYASQLAGWLASEQGLAGTKEQLLFYQLTVMLTI